MKKTIICDIDGTIFDYPPSGSAHIFHKVILLPGVLERFAKWEATGHNIILITGRRESLRKRTEASLIRHGIAFDQLIMGCADTGRVLINDNSHEGTVKAHAVALVRDDGMDNFNWEEVGL